MKALNVPRGAGAAVLAATGLLLAMASAAFAGGTQTVTLCVPHGEYQPTTTSGRWGCPRGYTALTVNPEKGKGRQTGADRSRGAAG